MDFIVMPSKKNIDDYIQHGCHYFLFSLKDFSVEANTYFSLSDIAKIRQKNKNIHIFISMNKNIFNHELGCLEKTLLDLQKLDVEGVFYYDCSLLYLHHKLNLNYPLVWAQTHMVTNVKTCNYYQQLGVKYALLSKEITKEEIIEIIKKTSLLPIVEVLSYPIVATSKRKLVTNYFQQIKKLPQKEISIDEKVSNQSYLVREDQNGTTFMKKSIMNGFVILDDLIDSELKYILLKEDYFDHFIFLQILDYLEEYLKNYPILSLDRKVKWQEDMKKLIGNDSNFFFKKTIYKVR